LVEQRTENPRVTSSSLVPGKVPIKYHHLNKMQFDFVYKVYQIYRQNYSDKNKLIAVSFGQDSISLLFFLFYIQQILLQPIHLLHCNHFYHRNNFYYVREGFKISYFINGNLMISCPINTITTETKQRSWRQRIFKRSVELLNFNSIYLGHTKTDKIETILFNLFRGSGLQGLTTLTNKSFHFEHQCFQKSNKKLKLKINKIKFIRPLLNSSRHSLKLIIKNNKIPNLIDFSNFNTNFTRNKIRLILIPLLKIYFNKNIETQIERLSFQLEIDNVFYNNQVEQLLKNKTKITRNNFKNLPKAVQYRLLKKVITIYSGREINFNLITKLQTKI
jgi:tRNA(Ile)-lysidine synthase